MRLSTTVLIVIAGCSGAREPEPAPGVLAVCAPSADHPEWDEVVFAALTATEWEDAGCRSTEPLPPTCNRLTLRRDGRYAWTAFSDYTERDDAGSWGLAARSETAGVVCFDDGSVIAFELSGAGGDLAFGAHGFAAADPIAYDASARARTRDELPRPTASATYSRLVAHAWRKSNDGDLDRLAQGFELHTDGTFRAEYRDEACAHGGRWSLEGETFTPISEPNTCDLRAGGSHAHLAASNDVPVFDDTLGLLLFRVGSSYRHAATADGRQTFVFDSYTDTLRTAVTFVEPLRAGTPSAVSLRFTNASDRAMQLDQLDILVSSTDGSGVAERIGGSPYGGAAVPSGTSSEDALEVTLPRAGDVRLEFELAYHDDRQPYAGRASYAIVIAE